MWSQSWIVVVIQQRSILDSDEPSHEPNSPIARLFTSESSPATGLWNPFWQTALVLVLSRVATVLVIVIGTRPDD
jgi:hypothetical protein